MRAERHSPPSIGETSSHDDARNPTRTSTEDARAKLDKHEHAVFSTLRRVSGELGIALDDDAKTEEEAEAPEVSRAPRIEATTLGEQLWALLQASTSIPGADWHYGILSRVLPTHLRHARPVLALAPPSRLPPASLPHSSLPYSWRFTHTSSTLQLTISNDSTTLETPVSPLPKTPPRPPFARRLPYGDGFLTPSEEP